MIAWYWAVIIGFGCFVLGAIFMALMAVAGKADKAIESMKLPDDAPINEVYPTDKVA